MRVTCPSFCHIRVTLLQHECSRVVAFLFSTAQTALQQMKCSPSFKLNFAKYFRLEEKSDIFSVPCSGKLDSGNVQKMESAKKLFCRTQM